MDLKAVQRLFGLIGYPLSHSFSKKYFADKYAAEKISDTYYELFPIETADQLPSLIDQFPNLVGLNVTIPYKQAVLPFLDDLSEEAAAVGAVNTIKIRKGKLKGYNSDVYGFQTALESFLPTDNRVEGALILGTGGAAKAVEYVLNKLDISFLKVSRSVEKGDIIYEGLEETHLKQYRLIINTTPLGMQPNIESAPNIPYGFLSEQHFLYDLVYNPEQTTFLAKGAQHGAAILNGLSMLHLQAEKSWKIWNAETF